MKIVSDHGMYPSGNDNIKVANLEGQKVRFYAPNEKTAWRYKTLFIKEPETIEWIRGLNEKDLLWDVGANVGIYTIFAALVAGCKAIAIEPGAANYWTLCKNIELNDLDRQVLAYCIALGEDHRCAELYMQTSASGGAQNSLDRPQDDSGKAFKPKFRQGMLSIPADVLIEQMGVECPTCIKIDVDGFELPLINGARRMLSNPKLKKVSIELNTINIDLTNSALKLLTEFGLVKTGEHRSKYIAPNSTVHNFHFERV